MAQDKRGRDSWLLRPVSPRVFQLAQLALTGAWVYFAGHVQYARDSPAFLAVFALLTVVVGIIVGVPLVGFLRFIRRLYRAHKQLTAVARDAATIVRIVGTAADREPAPLRIADSPEYIEGDRL